MVGLRSSSKSPSGTEIRASDHTPGSRQGWYENRRSGLSCRERERESYFHEGGSGGRQGRINTQRVLLIVLKMIGGRCKGHSLSRTTSMTAAPPPLALALEAMFPHYEGVDEEEEEGKKKEKEEERQQIKPAWKIKMLVVVTGEERFIIVV